MENQIKINATVVSNKGLLQQENGENFFLNGRFRHEYESDNIQVSIQNLEEQVYTFALCEGMDKERGDSKAFISMIRELKRFYEQIKANNKSMESIQNDLVERIKEINNLIHSISVGSNNYRANKTAFSGIVISRGKASVVNMGNSKVYMSRDGNVKQITVDHKKAERLVKLGIISSEQAEALSKEYVEPTCEVQAETQVYPLGSIKEGDVYLFCSEELANSIDEEIIQEMLAVKGETEYLANTLIREARKRVDSESMSVLVIRVENTNGFGAANTKSIIQRDEIEDEPDNSPIKAKTIISAVITSIVIMSLFAAAYFIWIKDKGQPNNSLAANDTSTKPSVSETVYKEEPPVKITDENHDNNTSFSPMKESTLYTVKAGDNLAKISKKFYNDSGKFKLIMDANNIKDANKITIGQVLIIPVPGDNKPKSSSTTTKTAP